MFTILQMAETINSVKELSLSGFHYFQFLYYLSLWSFVVRLDGRLLIFVY